MQDDGGAFLDKTVGNRSAGLAASACKGMPPPPSVSGLPGPNVKSVGGGKEAAVMITRVISSRNVRSGL